MSKRVSFLTAICFALAAFVFVAAPAWAQGVDEKIKALENELTRLKSEQMELRKEATTAAAALPTFSYRAGSGVLIEAADKSWSVRHHFRFHAWVPFQEGKDHRGRTQGEVMMRRVRPTFYLCLNNCFYEIEWALDLDGFGTNSALQRAAGYVHFENVHPWLPTYYIGSDVPSDINAYSQMSSNTSAQLEYDLLRRNNGYNTGRMGNGMGLRWEDVMIGPGRYRANFAMGTVGEGDDGLSSNTDRKDFVLYFQAEPFTRIKSKWIQGLGFSLGVWFCNVDDRGVAANNTGTTSEVGNGCADDGDDRLRMRDHGPGGRQTLIQLNGIGRGLGHYITPGLGWDIGPYNLRAILGFMGFQNQDDGLAEDKKAKNWMIAHQLYVWSPKGFLTGSSSTANSVLVGFHFERNDVACGHTRGLVMCAEGNEFSRNRVLLREWDLWYVIQRGMNVGLAFLWYDASNLRSGNNQAQANLLEKAGARTTAGKGGDWLDVILAWRWQY